MNRTDHNPEALLDAAIADVRNDAPDQAAAEEARRRVWARLAAEMQMNAEGPLTSCDDYQKLFPLYRDGSLSPSRHALVEDHLHECVRCRKALHPITVRMSPAMVSEMPKRRTSPVRWAMAAAAALAVTSLSFYAFETFGPVPDDGRMSVVAASGPVYRIVRGAAVPVHAGEKFARGERIRTSGGARATVRLHDGSEVELSERAELNVEATRRDATVQLGRGSIIVQAAKRDRGHLYVVSGDSRVAVTGTVFSVSRGLKGSRVSVIEGSVDVRYGRGEKALRAGDQLTTDASIGQVPLTDEIAWSANYDRHLALLKQFAELKGKLEQVKTPGLRYGSRLLDFIPENTSVYVSVPNLGRAVADVQRIVTTQAAQSPELRQWLQTQFPDFEKAAKHVEGIGEYLGEEIVVSFEPRCRGFCGVFIADVNRPGLKEYLQKEMPAGAPVLVTDLANLPAVPSDRMYVALTGNRVFVGAEPAFIRQAAAGNSKFAQTSFGQAVGDVYRRGAGVLVAANVGSVIERENTPGSVFSALGIDGMRHLIAEQRELGGKTTYSAVVTFDGQRRGVASWLAEPGSMGGLGFVSRDALFATAWVVKNPAQMLEDALTLTRLTSREELNVGEFEARTGVKLEDVAQALGSEVVFALDGPMVPTPAWKAVLEVKDSAKLQTAISKMVATANQSMPAGTAPIELTDGKLEDKQQGAQNMVAYKLSYPGGKMAEAHYAYVDGYMVIASTEAFLQRAIVDRRAGVSLSRSQEFRRLLPGGEHLNPSGIVYQNAGEVIRLMAKGAAEAAGNDAERQKRIEELAGNVEAGMVAVYGSADRIEVASQGSALNLLSQTLAGQMFGGPQSRGTTRSPRSYR